MVPVIAAALLGLAVGQAAPAQAQPETPAAAETRQQRLDACLARVEADAEAGYEAAMAWANLERSREARFCAAQALVKRGRYEAAARRFEGLAADQEWAQDNRVDAHSQAGNAWLLAGNGARAAEAFGHLARLTDNHPDALIDRARAFAMQKQWARAEEDLSLALDKRPNDALALMLRAAARMQQGAFELAVKDAENAVAQAPQNIDALLTLGQAREALRTRTPPP